jgi:hypothetical protein
MSEPTRPAHAADYPAYEGRQNVEPTEMTAWVGWIAFAGAMMVLLGIFHVVDGLVALFRNEVFLVGRSGLTIEVDYTTWGWVHLIGGVLIVLAGIGLFIGNIFARSLGVLLAMISAVVNLAFLPAYPVWSAIMIAMDLMVIWALTVHGGELRKP